MNNNKHPVWSTLLQVLIAILTAIATTFGIQSCM